MSETKATKAIEETTTEAEVELTDIIIAARKLLGAMTATAVTMPKHMPMRPWPDTTNRRTSDDFLQTEEQIVVILPVKEFTDIFDVVPMMEEMAARVADSEDKARAEWARTQDLEKRVVVAEEKINSWRSLAEDYDGSSFAQRARRAEKREAELEDALRFYADADNWKPEPVLIKAGTSVKDKGGIAREAMKK